MEVVLMDSDGDSTPALHLDLPIETKKEEQHEQQEAREELHFHPFNAHVEKDLVDQQKDGYHVRAHEHPPPLYQATLGLSKTYTLVRESRDKIRPRAWSASTTETRLYTSDDGSLRLGPHLPLLMGRYRFIRLIGQGTFAQIICAEDTYHPSRRQVAIKILNFHYSEIGKREALCLRVVHTESPEGPYSAIVRYFGAFDFMGHFCLVLELCQGGSLQTHIRPLDSTTSTSSSSATNMKSHEGLSLEQIREASLHLVKALLLLHNHDVIHADIKPENVLLLFNNKSSSSSSSTTASSNSSSTSLLGNDVRLTDLGNAIKSREVKLYKEDYEIQTLGYRAPEVLMGGANGKAFDHQIDMWSLGVLLVELFLGRPLFRAASTMLMVKRIVSVLGPLPARKFITGKFYTSFFGADHRLRPEALALKDDPLHAATALTDPARVQNMFNYDGGVHYRLICELLRTRDQNFISFICGLLQLDPDTRLTAFEALMHPFLAPYFPFSLLRPFLGSGIVNELQRKRAVVNSSSSSSSNRGLMRETGRDGELPSSSSSSSLLSTGTTAALLSSSSSSSSPPSNCVVATPAATPSFGLPSSLLSSSSPYPLASSVAMEPVAATAESKVAMYKDAAVSPTDDEFDNDGDGPHLSLSPPRKEETTAMTSTVVRSTSTSTASSITSPAPNNLNNGRKSSSDSNNAAVSTCPSPSSSPPASPPALVLHAASPPRRRKSVKIEKDDEEEEGQEDKCDRRRDGGRGQNVPLSSSSSKKRGREPPRICNNASGSASKREQCSSGREGGGLSERERTPSKQGRNHLEDVAGKKKRITGAGGGRRVETEQSRTRVSKQAYASASPSIPASSSLSTAKWYDAGADEEESGDEEEEEELTLNLDIPPASSSRREGFDRSTRPEKGMRKMASSTYIKDMSEGEEDDVLYL